MKYSGWILLALSFYSCSLLGCKSLGIGKQATESTNEDAPWWKKEDLPPLGSPSKIVGFWSNSVFNESGALPVRGLGGRIYFYDAKHQTVRVDGSLTVFLYDDTDEAAREAQEANRKITFTAEEVASKYTPTEFGPSYSFWLPWDEVGGERVQLSVIPVFTSKEGEMLVGEQARYLLPGKKPTALSKASDNNSGVVAASFEMQSSEGPAGNSDSVRLKTTTIKVPRSVQRRLRSTAPGRHERSRQPATTSTGRVTAQDLRPRIAELRKKQSDKGAKYGMNIRRTPHEPVIRKTVRDADAMGQSPKADFQPDPHQAQALRSAQQAVVRDQNVLDRAKSLFAR